MPNPIAIKEVVSSIIQGLGAESNSEKDKVAQALNTVLGKGALRHTRAQYYQNQKLVINVDSSAWLYKLNLEQREILSKLNSLLPHADIKELLFKLGRV